MVSSLNSLKSTLNGTINSTNNNKLKDNADDLLKSVNALKKTVNFGAIFMGLRQGWNIVKDISNANMDMIETNNLFAVSMGKVVDEYGNLDEAQSKYYVQAMKFQDEMNEKLATNKTELMKYQAMYYSMFKAQGINKDASYFMSENLTKAGYDISSLFNLTVDEAMDKIRAGIAGQVEPLRAIGIDISESSLQTVLKDVGITNRTVQQLSYAEKEVARYIAIVKQAGQAQGDFAKTFESPANQVRVFKNQLTELKQVAGSFIINTFGGIITYANAIIMVLKEIIKSFATLFGYDLSSGDSNLGSSITDVDSGLGSAVGKAKELKKQLMGFDEINNITPQTSSSSGGSGIATGVDDKLLEALKKWDNKMGDLNGKAQQIRDKMLEWLGFERDDNGTWKLQEGYNNLEKILDVVKIIGVAFASWKISTTLTNFLKNMGILGETQAFKLAFGIGLSITGIFAQYKGTEHLLDGDIDLFSILETILGTAGGTFGIANLLKSSKLGQVLKMNEALRIGLGIMLAIQGLQVAFDGIKEDDIQKQLAGALETGVGAFSGFSAYGGLKYGLKIGVIFTIATAEIELGFNIVEWWNEYWDIYKKELYNNKQELNLGENLNIGFSGIGEGFTKSITDATAGIAEFFGITTVSREELNKLSESVKEITSSYKEYAKSIDERISNNNLELEGTKALAKELKNLVDENGKVKEGCEARADIILNDLNNSLGLELSRDGDLIKKNGEVVKSYDNLIDSIEDTIEKRKVELKMEAYGELYKESVKKKVELQDKLTKALEKQKKAQEEYNYYLKNGIDGASWLVIQENLNLANRAVEDLEDSIGECEVSMATANQGMVDSQIMTTGIITEEMIKQGTVSAEALSNMAKTYRDNWNSTYESLDKDTQKAMLSMSTIIGDNAPVVIEKWTQLSKGSYDTFNENLSQIDIATRASLLSTLTETEGMTPNITKAWSDLATQSATDFNDGIKDLPSDVQSNILASIAKVDGLTDETKTAWYNLSKKAPEEYDKAISGLSDDTKKEIEDAITEIENKEQSMGDSAEKLGNNASDKFSNGLGDSSTSAYNFVKGFTDFIEQSDPTGIFKKIKSFARKVVNKFNEGLDEHSPSKETAKSAKYFALGFTNQLDKSAVSMLNQVGSVATDITNSFADNLGMVDILKGFNGIKVDQNDLAINANQYVDYSTISGNIKTQASISAINISEKVYEAVIKGMANSTVNVDIIAKTDEGTIVEKASQGFKDIVMQTGELPFPVPIG